MDCRGQGSLEYLLLIGGAVLVAAIVIGILVTQSTSSANVIGIGSNKFQQGLNAIENEIMWGNTI